LYNQRQMSLFSALARILDRASFLSRYRVAGESMTPTLRDGQQVLAVSAPRSGRPLPRGALVVFKHPESPDVIYIKRIVGLPGEDLFINDDGRAHIGGESLPEPYLAPMPSLNENLPARRATARRWITEADEYFIMGDNRHDSRDSRSFGPVHHDWILGRVWLRCWPPQGWSFLGRR